MNKECYKSNILYIISKLYSERLTEELTKGKKLKAIRIYTPEYKIQVHQIILPIILFKQFKV